MGIYDREYYRREGHSFLGSFTERGRVCKWLILFNVLLFVLQLLSRHWGADDDLTSPYDVSPYGPVTSWLMLDVPRVLQGEVWRLLTYAFLHDEGNFTHILFNMLFLWWFGTDVEDLYGSREFLTFYLTAAVAGGLGFILTYLLGITHSPFCIGASGAVTAVMVLCACHFPTRTILLFWLLPIPIWLFVLFNIAQDSFGLLSGHSGGVAVSVHLAGAGFAFGYFKLQGRLSGPWYSAWLALRSWWSERSRPRLRVYREEEESRKPVKVSAPAAPADVDEHLEAKLDAVLEKVSRHGKDSLTESEQQILLRASEVYKRRRS